MRLIAVVVLLAALLAVVPVQAQLPPTDSITLTEGFINANLQAGLTPDSGLSSLYVDLKPGLIVLGAVTTGEMPLDISITLLPTVVNGRIETEATTVAVNGFEIDLTQFQADQGSADAVDGLQDVLDDAAGGNFIDSLEVTESTITLSWTRLDPAGPGFTMFDNDISLSFTETYINNLPDFVTPNDPDLTDLSVDFQPGQLVLNATRRQPDGSLVPSSITALPTVSNGIVTWTVTALVINGQAEDDLGIARMNDNLTASWRMFFSGLYRSGNLANIVLTEDMVTLTWDGDLEAESILEINGGVLIVSETEINQTYRVTNPPNINVTDVFVDLQPGQVTISANLNLSNGTVIPETVTFVPSIVNGTVVWTVTAITLGDEALPQEVIDGLNDALANYWNNIIWSQTADWVVTEVTVTETQIEVRARPR